MLNLDTRSAILLLDSRGLGQRAIADALGISRNTVRKVLESGEAEVPGIERDELLAPHIDRIRELHRACKGNCIRVAEELRKEGVSVAYSTLTGFCRRHQIGVKPKPRSGRYEFGPGQEMQHDTSPHVVEVGGRRRTLQCASVVLCYSRKKYVQCYPRWSRFLAKVFLTEAFRYFDGTAADCMLDNSNVIVLRGTGANAVMVPEMIAFGDRFNVTFKAHEKGDANRSARVERPFHHVENNFYPGREFTDLADLNAQLRIWCDDKNAEWTRWLHASPNELFAAELSSLQPLPDFVPDVYELHQRRVDTEGFVSLHTNRYSMPESVPIEIRVTVHEYHERLRVFDGHKLIVEHVKAEHGARQRVRLPEHRSRRRRPPAPPTHEETVLRAVAPELSALVDALRKRHGGQAARAVRRLYRIYLDYPTEPVVAAVGTALEFGLLDLTRIERMVLRGIAGDFFRLPTDPQEDPRGRRPRSTAEEPEAEPDPEDPD